MGFTLVLLLAFCADEPHPNSRFLEFNRASRTAKRAARMRLSCSTTFVGLRDFYNRPLGGIVRRLLTQRIRARWRSAQGAS